MSYTPSHEHEAAENAQGQGNPGAEARRIPKESAQADDIQETQEAVSYLPHEEVASETSSAARPVVIPPSVLIQVALKMLSGHRVVDAADTPLHERPVLSS